MHYAGETRSRDRTAIYNFTKVGGMKQTMEQFDSSIWMLSVTNVTSYISSAVFGQLNPVNKSLFIEQNVSISSTFIL